MAKFGRLINRFNCRTGPAVDEAAGSGRSEPRAGPVEAVLDHFSMCRTDLSCRFRSVWVRIAVMRSGGARNRWIAARMARTIAPVTTASESWKMMARA